MSWLGRSLAAHGYIVAAVDHPGNNSMEPYTVEGFLEWWERARDLSAVADGVLADPALGPLVDRRRIGAIGFSLGGYTVLEIAGARTDPRLLRNFCRSNPAEGCADPPEFPGLFERWDALANADVNDRRVSAAAARSYRDPRVRAVFAMAPAVGQALIPDSLRRIAIPVALAAGDADTMVPLRSNAEHVAGLVRGSTFRVLTGVGHYTFLAVCADEGRLHQPRLCSDAVGVDRARVHDDVIRIAVDFFKSRLN
jgi:predicted dienelactone hydrolase